MDKPTIQKDGCSVTGCSYWNLGGPKCEVGVCEKFWNRSRAYAELHGHTVVVRETGVVFPTAHCQECNAMVHRGFETSKEEWCVKLEEFLKEHPGTAVAEHEV